MKHQKSKYQKPSLGSVLGDIPGRSKPSSFDRSQDKSHHSLRLAVFMIAAGLVLLGLLAIRGAFKQFQADDIVIGASGPDHVASASPVTYTFYIENTESIPLSEVIIFAQFPAPLSLENSFPEPVKKGRNTWQLNNIEPDEKRLIRFSGMLYGEIGSEQTVTFDVRFTPKGYSLTYERRAALTTKIIDSPIRVEIQAPDKMAFGESVEISTRVQNISRKSIDNYILEINPPDELEIEKSSPVMSFERRPIMVELSSLKPEQEKRIHLFGSLKEYPKTTPLVFNVYVKDGKDGPVVTQSSKTISVGVQPVHLSLVQEGEVADTGSPAILRSSFFVQQSEGVRNLRLNFMISGDVPIERAEMELSDGKVISRGLAGLPELISIGEKDSSIFSIMDGGEGASIVLVLYPNINSPGGVLEVSCRLRGSFRNNSEPFDVVSDVIKISYEGSVQAELSFKKFGGDSAQFLFVLQNMGQKMNNLSFTFRLPKGANFMGASEVDSGSLGYVDGNVVWSIPWVPASSNNQAIRTSASGTINVLNMTSEEIVRAVSRGQVSWKDEGGLEKSLNVIPKTSILE